jgi:hypothetical protein
MTDTLLKQGDVIVVDASWKIVTFDKVARLMTVGQQTKWSNKKKREIPVYDGPSCAAVRFSPENITLEERVKQAGVALHVGDEYLVVKTEMNGGGTGHGPHDVFPDGHCVDAIKLGTGRSFDPNGLRIQFYQTGSFNCKIPAPKRTGHMEVRYGEFIPL